MDPEDPVELWPAFSLDVLSLAFLKSDDIVIAGASD